MLNIVEEDENGFVVTTAASEFEIGPSQRARSERRDGGDSSASSIVVRIDKILLWADPIAVGTNPLIGHSVVLKTYADGSKGNNHKQKMIACAVLGIVPSC